MAEEIGAEKYIAVSARTGDNLKQLFADAVDIALAARTMAENPKSPKPKSDEDNSAPAVVIRKKPEKRRNCLLL